MDITDPLGSTLMVIEASEENAVPWMMPVDADESVILNLAAAAKLHHVGGMNASLVDGSVHFLRSSTPPKVWRSLITISGHDNQSSLDW